MKRPFIDNNIRRPMEYDYKKHKRNVRIYSYFEKTRNEYEDDRYDYGYDETNINQPKTPNVKLEKINLQFILDLLPEGVKPSDVKIKMNVITSSMDVEGVKITFYYEKVIPAKLKLYKKHKAEFDVIYKKWEEEDKIYQQYLKDEEIKNLTEKINNLKEKK